jgi:hypothetical protein
MQLEEEYIKAKKIVESYELRLKNLRENNCKHKWKYLSGSPWNELHKCSKCGFIA